MLQGQTRITLSPWMIVGCCVPVPPTHTPPSHFSFLGGRQYLVPHGISHTQQTLGAFTSTQCLHFQPTTNFKLLWSLNCMSLAADAWTLHFFLSWCMLEAKQWCCVTVALRQACPHHIPWPAECIYQIPSEHLLVSSWGLLWLSLSPENGLGHIFVLADLGNVKIWSTEILFPVMRKILFLFTSRGKC